MSIKRPEGGSPHINEEAAISAFKECLTFVKNANPMVVIFNLVYTAGAAHKFELYYSLRGKDEISPMGTAVHEYASLEMFKTCMSTDFSGLEYPL